MISPLDICVDIESDGLFPSVSKVHIVCILERQTGVIHSFRTKEQLREYIGDNANVLDRVILHNGIGFDLPALYKLWSIPFDISSPSDRWMGQDVFFVDTFHLSQFLCPDRLGGHSLENLSELAGVPKLNYQGDFSAYTEDMETYCKGDTRSLSAVYDYLMRSAKEMYPFNPDGDLQGGQ